MGRSLRAVGLVAATIVSMLVVTPGAPARAATGPGPLLDATVSGPIAAQAKPGAPSHDYPFGASLADLRRHGYVEQEFFFSGVTAAGPYTSRMLVRRPADPARSSGTVLAEWTNVTNGYDLDCYWARSADQLMRTGATYVAIDAQTEGVQNAATGLKAWNPERYAALTIPPSGTFVAEAAAYEIFGQALKALRSPVGADPTGGLPVQRLLATGCSQSAATLTIYESTFGVLHGLVDGYLITILSTNTTEYPGDLVYPPLGTIADGVPVLQVNSESDRGALALVPDSDTYRLWEVAGAVHVDADAGAYIDALYRREFGKPAPARACALPPLSEIPLRNAQAAAFVSLERWVRDGTPPTKQSRFVYAADGSLVQDDLSRVRGGVRLPELEVPTADNGLENDGADLGCRNFYGHHVPYTAATLRRLYPTKTAYLAAFQRASATAVRAGVLLPEDARASNATARRVVIPSPAAPTTLAPGPRPTAPPAKAVPATAGRPLAATGADSTILLLASAAVLLGLASRRVMRHR